MDGDDGIIDGWVDGRRKQKRKKKSDEEKSRRKRDEWPGEKGLVWGDLLSLTVEQGASATGADGKRFNGRGGRGGMERVEPNK